jgi:hypothetical protein
MAVDHDILHGDYSLYNLMIMEGPNDSRGLLINWEFAVFITSNIKCFIGGTVNIYFLNAQNLIDWFIMAQSLLCCTCFLWQNCRPGQYSKKHGNPPPKLWHSHHLWSFKALGMIKSIFYVFAYICIKYSGPNSKEHQESIPDPLPDSWSNLNWMCAN